MRLRRPAHSRTVAVRYGRLRLALGDDEHDRCVLVDACTWGWGLLDDDPRGSVAGAMLDLELEPRVLYLGNGLGLFEAYERRDRAFSRIAASTSGAKSQ